MVVEYACVKAAEVSLQGCRIEVVAVLSLQYGCAVYGSSDVNKSTSHLVARISHANISSFHRSVYNYSTAMRLPIFF